MMHRTGRGQEGGRGYLAVCLLGNRTNNLKQKAAAVAKNANVGLVRISGLWPRLDGGGGMVNQEWGLWPARLKRGSDVCCLVCKWAG